MVAEKKEMVLGGATVTVGLPNIGQDIAIEVLKMKLTGFAYPVLASSPMDSHSNTLDRVDALAYGSVLCEAAFRRLFGTLDTKQVLEGDLKGPIVELVRWYKDEYVPFYSTMATREDRDIKPNVPKEEPKEVQIEIPAP